MVTLGLFGPGLMVGGAIIAATGVRPSAQRTDAVQVVVDVHGYGLRTCPSPGSIERFIPKAMERIRKSGLAYSPVCSYPQPVRLGLEMALHEEAEWRAMEGELAELEAAWREAERIAGIADDLVLPRHVNVFMDKYRKRP